MVIVKASKASEAGVLPSEKLLAEMGKYNEELTKAACCLWPKGSMQVRRGRGSSSPEGSGP
jgi:hypothetical protein